MGAYVFNINNISKLILLYRFNTKTTMWDVHVGQFANSQKKTWISWICESICSFWSILH